MQALLALIEPYMIDDDKHIELTPFLPYFQEVVIRRLETPEALAVAVLRRFPDSRSAKRLASLIAPKIANLL